MKISSVVFMLASLAALASSPVQAGSWSIRYAGGLAGSTPYQMQSDGFYGGKALNAACGSPITISVSWKEAYRGELPPTVVYLHEESRAEARNFAPIPEVPPPGSTDNGIGSGHKETLQPNGVPIVDLGLSAGFRVIPYSVPRGGRFIVTREPIAVGASTSVGYRMVVKEFVYSIRYGNDDTMRPSDQRDEYGRATPVPSCDPLVVSPRRGDTVVNTNSFWGQDPFDSFRYQDRSFAAIIESGTSNNPFHRWDLSKSDSSFFTKDWPYPPYFEDTYFSEYNEIDFTYNIHLEGKPPIKEFYRLQVVNNGGIGPESAVAEYELTLHNKYERVERMWPAAPTYNELTTTYPDGQHQLSYNESIRIKAYYSSFAARWCELNEPIGEVFTLASGFLQMPWNIVLAAAGFTIQHFEPAPFFETRVWFDELWNLEQSVIQPPKSAGIPQGAYRLIDVNSRVKKINHIFRIDEYGTGGFEGTTFLQMNTPDQYWEYYGIFEGPNQ